MHPHPAIAIISLFVVLIASVSCMNPSISRDQDNPSHHGHNRFRVLIIGIMLQMFITQPIMLNPFSMMEKLNDWLIETGTLYMMAMMAPVMFLLCFSLVIIAIILGFSVIKIEKRYIGIIGREETV